MRFFYITLMTSFKEKSKLILDSEKNSVTIITSNITLLLLYNNIKHTNLLLTRSFKNRKMQQKVLKIIAYVIDKFNKVINKVFIFNQYNLPEKWHYPDLKN